MTEREGLLSAYHDAAEALTQAWESHASAKRRITDARREVLGLKAALERRDISVPILQLPMAEPHHRCPSRVRLTPFPTPKE